MPDANKTNTDRPKGNLVRRISGVLALVVIVVSSFMYIPDEDPGGGEILAGLFMGSCTGAAVLALGWVVAHLQGRNSENASEQRPQSAIGKRPTSPFQSATRSRNDLTPREQEELNSLIQRVPFTSLSWIISLMVACGLISLGGLAILIVNAPVPPEQKHFIVYAILISGFGAFGFWSALPRRKGYREKFEEMLARKPIASWKYSDEEWETWLKFAERLAYGRTRNTTPWKVVFMVVAGSLIGGTLLYLMRSDTRFVEACGLCVGLLSLPVLFSYLYWRHLRQDWERRPSEARIFEKAVFFHHKFVDWRENPDEGVLVVVETEDQPIATLSVRLRNGGAKLAPHLSELSVPIPQDRVNDAREMARSLCQNVNLDKGDA